MIRFILTLVILSLCMTAGYFVQTFPARVNILVNNYVFSTNLIIWLITSFIASMLILILLRFFRFIWKSPSLFSNNNIIRKRHKSFNLLKAGLDNLYAGKFAKAEAQLVRGAKIAEKIGDSSVLFYESAAIAANHLQAHDRRDRYFLLTRQNIKTPSLAAEINEASAYIDNKEYAKATQILEQLAQSKNQKVLQLLDSAYAEQEQWQKAWNNLQKLRPFLSDSDYESRKIRYVKGMLQDTPEIESFEQLQQAWQSLPKDLQNNKEIILQYASCLLDNEHSKMAQDLLLKHLKKTKDIDYIQAYIQLNELDYEQAIKVLQAQESSFKEEALFYYALAKMAFRAKKLDLASQNIERSLQLKPSSEAFALWGEILEAQGQPQAALSAYRHSIMENKEKHFLEGVVLPSHQLPHLSSEQ